MQKLLILLFDDNFLKFNLDDSFNKLLHNATHYHNTYLKMPHFNVCMEIKNKEEYIIVKINFYYCFL